MRHVKEIRAMIEQGQVTEAQDALEQLLSLGPKNTEALKLRALLYEQQGRFGDEAQVWDQVIKVDREDPDAVSYMLRRQVEDREHFYFTDDMPGGGRKFLAYPRSLITLSGFGLVGCLAFLTFTQMAGRLPVLNQPAILFGLFALLVLSPWAAIIYSYLRMMKHVAINTRGIEIATRFNSHSFAWDQVDKVCLAHGYDQSAVPHLSLVVVPTDAALPVIEIDLNQSSTSIRARAYLVREVSRSSKKLAYGIRSDLPLAGRKMLKF